jgi:hypothetical protein
VQLVVIVVVLVVVLGVFALVRSRQSNDGVEGFRRQIDALSSDARRPTIDRGPTPDGTTRAERTDGQPDPDSPVTPNEGDRPDATESVDRSADTGGPANIDPGFSRGSSAQRDDAEPNQDPAESGTPEDDPNGA